MGRYTRPHGSLRREGELLKIDIDLFGVILSVFVGDKGKQKMLDAIKKDHGVNHEIADDSKGHTYGSYIWMQKASIDTAVHEANHVVDEVFISRKIEDPSGEVKSYMLGYIMERIHKKFNLK